MDWSATNCREQAKLCTITDNKFSERIKPNYAPRATTRREKMRFPRSINMYHYFDFSLPSSNELRNMRQYVPNQSYLELLAEVNRHDRLAGVIGILPNALIKLIKLTRYYEHETIIHDLRISAFWSGYLVWMARQKLHRTYWREKIPEQWKTEGKTKKSANSHDKRKKRRKNKKMAFEACRNMFHYLMQKNPQRSPLVGTCNCLSQTTTTRVDNKVRISGSKQNKKHKIVLMKRIRSQACTEQDRT